MMLRRLIALCLAAAVLAIPICSLLVDWRIAEGACAWFGYSLFGFGAIVGLANFYLSFFRYPFLMLRGRSPDDIRFISCIPIVGMAVIPGLVLTPPSLWLSTATLAVLAVDTGNLPWFVVAVWKDRSFWET